MVTFSLKDSNVCSLVSFNQSNSDSALKLSKYPVITNYEAEELMLCHF